MNGHFKIGELSAHRYFLVAAVLTGLLFAFIAPDDDLKTHWALHLLQWQIQTVVPTFLAIGAHILIANVAGTFVSNPWWRLCLSGTIAAAIFAPLALLTDVALADEALAHNVATETAHEFAAIAPPIIIGWLAINLPFQLGYQLSKPTQTNRLEASSRLNSPSTNAPNFMELVAKDRHGTIIYLKSELHYVLVVTEFGRDLILYTLKDAVSELLNQKGFQPHRSFWVNTDFIKSLDKVGRQGQLTLKNGEIIPVSRSKMKSISEFMPAN